MLVVSTCLDHFNIYEDDLESTNLEPAIASLFRNLMQKPHFSMTFSGLMRDRSISETFLVNLSTALKLSACEKVGFGLSLLDSENNDVKTAGRKFCMSQCEALCDVHDTIDVVAADVLDVLKFLEQSEVLSKHVDSFKLMILQVWLNANSRFILADKAHDSKLLSQIDFRIVDPTEMPKETCASLFARMLGMTLISIFHENRTKLDSFTNATEGFQLRADVAFSLLMSCYRNTCQAPFPLAVVCGDVWENAESQLLFLKHAVSSQTEVFTFAHCKRQLEHVDHKFQADHASQPWLCLDLLEVLCQLAEEGHVTSIRSLMEFPLKNCPEVLLLGMAHVITSYNLLQHEVSKSVLPMLLEDSSKSGIILRLWRVNPLLLSRTLNDSLNSDPDNINRVVDLFQELEILLSVLDLVPMSLGIKLDIIASSKEFIDLEEWLSTNLSASEDIFFEECLKFVKEVKDNPSEVPSICKEAAPTFSKVDPINIVLKLHTELLASNKLPEQMESLYVTCMQNSPKMESIDVPDSSTSESYAVRLETKNSSSPSTGSTPGKVSLTSASSINTLLAASGNREISIEVPPSEIQDKILFIVNNLSDTNIEAKTKEFTAILEERYYPWFAQYLVMKRAGVELNFHNIYINFLEQTRSKQLNKEIVKASYENCKVLLRSDLLKSSVEERKLLKNLGGWLGKLTIGRNQALLAKHIDPKPLITEAYEKGSMIGVIPFISKILELCQSSAAYQLPNPWTMAILGLLVEIHAMPNLKANLTFEIEVLFKNLNVDMKEVKPTSLLKDKARITEGNPDFSERKIVEEVKSTVRYDVNQVELLAEAAGPSYQGGPSHIVYQPTVPASTISEFQSSVLEEHFLRFEFFSSHCSVLPMAMNKAVEELVSTIVQRSVSIASQTTIELTLKEPLRILLSTHLRNSVTGLNIVSEFLEDVMQRVIDAKLHLACASIEKNATEKGLIMVKKELTEQLSKRKKQKEASSSFISKAIEPSYTTSVAVDKSHVLLMKLEALIANDATEAQIQSLSAEVRAVILKCIRKDEAALAVAQNVFEGLYENAFNAANINSRLTILAAICDVNKLVGKELTGWVLHSDDRKFNKDITVGLIRRRLLNLAEYSFHMARLINIGKNGIAIEFAISLVKTLETSDARVISELRNVTDALAKVTYRPVARNDDYHAMGSYESDPLHGQVSMLLAEWCRMHDHPGVSDAVRAHYVQEVYRNVLSKSDDMPNRFFCTLLELVISHYRQSQMNSSPLQFHNQERVPSFLAIDIYTDLVFSILKVLTGIVGFITKDENEKKAPFDSRPYFRLFINFINHLSTNSAIDDADFEASVVIAISSSFHALQPAKVPEFSFAWVELVSLKDFMPKLVSEDNQKGWSYFQCLLIDLLQFMEPLLRDGELTEPVRVLYSGTLRMLAVLSHDFPKFICYYHFSLCKAISPQCTELRNIVLSALPHNMRIPRPEHPLLEGQSAVIDKSTTLPSSQL
ncbi:hypothetical protein L1987_39363 [Smallanthus sonchifolius]|uniref:Uncharacterized protein n=1 Tax=Smallanthus sonchifolius TaxID=185202 RepID=A0ACB9HLT7_9ASTR|nr:hypothetical protein L1987_39363 [Smallanthus sonchifolius]